MLIRFHGLVHFGYAWIIYDCLIIYHLIALEKLHNVLLVQWMACFKNTL